jgi:SAM-dependent methyltransferase
MINYSSKDINSIKRWRMNRDPFVAIKDFSFLKCELRWLNREQKEAYKKYWNRRYKWTSNINFRKYYKHAKKPIDKKTWDYLRIRKSYFIMPLGWDRIAKNGGTILDFGCGDGDITQNFIDFVTKYQKKYKIKKKVNIIGIDINKSRIENAKNFVYSATSNIKVNFVAKDLIENKFTFKKNFFDYCLCVGVFEILDERSLLKLLAKLKKIVKKGIYIEDLFERFPGGWPRDNLGDLLLKNNFLVKKRHVIFTEPFNKNKLSDPKKIWPIMLDQNIFAEKY